MFISLPHCTVENAALERRPIPRPVLGARDGATIVNYLHWFYETAYGRASTIVETCYFSITCNIVSLIFRINWREVDDDEVSFWLEIIDSAMLF
jgi:hypothetical protein